MLVTRLVVFCRAFHQAGGKGAAIQFSLDLPRRHLFDQVQERAAVAVSHFKQGLARRTIERQGAAQLLFGTLREAFEISEH